jgi:uncharacterized protein YjdB
MWVFNGSTGAVRGNQGAANGNFGFRNTSAYPNPIVEVKLIVTGGTIDASDAARNLIQFSSSSSFAVPTSTQTGGTRADQTTSGVSTVTWTASAVNDYRYFRVYNLKTTGTALAAAVNSIQITYQTGETIAVSSVTVSLASSTISSGGTSQATALISPENATSQSLSWTSSNTSVATVNSSGLVTANSSGVSGPTTIRATSVADATKFGEAVLTVNPVLVTSISVTFGQASIGIGSTTTATGSVLPANATNKIFTWSSSDEAVATVNAGGTVTGVSAGSAFVIATASDASGVTGSSAITVTSPIAVSSLNFTTSEPLEILVGELSSSNQFSATLEVDPSNASDLGVTFASSNSSIVEVASSSRASNIWTVKLIGKSMGIATITATADSDGTKTDTLEVVVKLHNESSPTLIISEYIESGLQKAIEITNLTSSAIDLTTYSLRLYSNGSTTPSPTTLSGSVDANQSVFFKNSASSLISGGTTNSAVNFGGDDAIALFNGTSDIDVFGVIGNDPGTAWSRTFNSGAGTTEDVTLRRKPSVYHATSVWNPLEWDVFAVNTFDGLGTHTLSASANADLYANLFMALTNNMQGNSMDGICSWVGADKWSTLQDQYSTLPNVTKDFFGTKPAKISTNDAGDMLLRYVYLRNVTNSGLTLNNFLVNASSTNIYNLSGNGFSTISNDILIFEQISKIIIGFSLLLFSFALLKKKFS